MKISKATACAHFLYAAACLSGLCFISQAHAIQPHPNGTAVLNEKLDEIEKQLNQVNLEANLQHVGPDRLTALEKERSALEGEQEKLLRQIDLSESISQNELVIYAVPEASVSHSLPAPKKE